MKRALVGLLCLAVGVLYGGGTAEAASLTIEPLQYQVNLAPGERQKGFVDITNPNSQTVTVTTSVQAFRQIDDKGSLQFYQSSAVSAGVTADLSEFSLGPREAVRMYFIVDGTKLPPGDVFAALFATIKPPAQPGVTGSRQTVRVGTILSIVNGTPGSRQAVITDLSLGFFQFDTHIKGAYTIKNTADPTKTTGFYPTVTLTMTPFTTTTHVSSSLIYAGRSRDNAFTFDTARFGLYKVTADYHGSHRSQWIFVVTGVWSWVVLGVLVVLGGVAGWWLRWRHQRRRMRLGRHV